MKVLEIYEKYNIPSNLQNHMLMASSLAKLICEKWRGHSVNVSDILTTMLIHDIGNIAKMDFSSLEKLPEENKDLGHWQSVQQAFIKKYGADDHIATFNIASELSLSTRIRWLVINKIFVHNEMIAASDDFDLKICAYADQKTGPDGIVSLEDRFAELRGRYGSKPGASINHPRIEYLIRSSFEIEKQVLHFVSMESDESVNNRVRMMTESLYDYGMTTT
jgi:hypothetical protein